MADGVLIAEEADLPDGSVEWDGCEPLHRREPLAPVGIVGKVPIVLGPRQNFQGWYLVSCGVPKQERHRRFERACYAGDPAGDPEALEWDILLAPHHCSRRSLGRVEEVGKDEEFQESEKALKALGCQVDQGYVVSSSRRFGRNGSPPSTHARNRYYRILARAQSMADVTQADRDRFLVSGGSTAVKPDHIVFDLTLRGPSRRRETKAPVAPAVVSSVGAGGGYG